MKHPILQFNSIVKRISYWVWMIIFGLVGSLKAEMPPLRSPHKSKEFVSFTMPKTGTHLLKPLLEKLTGRNEIWADSIFPQIYIRDYVEMLTLLSFPDGLSLHWLEPPVDVYTLSATMDRLSARGNFLASHAPYSEEMESFLKKRNCLVFFLIRDPRDYVISVINHPGCPGLDIIVDPWFKTLSMDKQIHHVIVGTDWYNSTPNVLSKFMPWRNSSICCVLRYEKLLGPKGGGATQKEQIAELRKIANVLKLDVTDNHLLRVFNESFGIGNTFRTGTVGKWKKHFSEEHKALFKELAGNYLIELGYEKDNNW